MAKSWLPKVKVAGEAHFDERRVISHAEYSLTNHSACNVSPVFLNTKATVSKTIGLIREAASNSADLVVFPETHIPG
jgi:hypothetical protein